MGRRAKGIGRGQSRLIPLAPVERLIKLSGGERVGVSASAALAEILETEGMNLAMRAARIARHAGRKTVTAEDIKMARA